MAWLAAWIMKLPGWVLEAVAKHTRGLGFDFKAEYIFSQLSRNFSITTKLYKSQKIL